MEDLLGDCENPWSWLWAVAFPAAGVPQAPPTPPRQSPEEELQAKRDRSAVKLRTRQLQRKQLDLNQELRWLQSGSVYQDLAACRRSLRLQQKQPTLHTWRCSTPFPYTLAACLNQDGMHVTVEEDPGHYSGVAVERIE